MTWTCQVLPANCSLVGSHRWRPREQPTAQPQTQRYACGNGKPQQHASNIEHLLADTHDLCPLGKGRLRSRVRILTAFVIRCMHAPQLQASSVGKVHRSGAMVASSATLTRSALMRRTFHSTTLNLRCPHDLAATAARDRCGSFHCAPGLLHLLQQHAIR